MLEAKSRDIDKKSTVGGDRAKVSTCLSRSDHRDVLKVEKLQKLG